MRSIMGVAVALSLALLPMRAIIVGMTWEDCHNPVTLVPRVLLIGFYDLAFVFGLTLAFGLLAWALRRRPRWQRASVVTFWLLAALALLGGAANISVVKMLGQPFNYQWLYYSDFLGSFDARNSLAASVTGAQVLIGVGLLVLFLATAWLIGRGVKLSFEYVPARRVAGVALAATVIYFGLSYWAIHRKPRDFGRLHNPAVAFAVSMVERADGASLLVTMDTPVGPGDFATIAESPPAVADHPFSPEVRNVILIVLESVAVEYVHSTHNGLPVTPVLDAQRGRSAEFGRVYAHVPYTPKSLVTLLCSVHPWLSYRVVTTERPDIPLPSVSAELKRAGYRTGFFSSSDNRFQNFEGFLAHRGFDRVADYRDIPCEGPLMLGSTEEWPFLDGVDDRCTMEAMLGWIDEGGGREPFFGVLWTNMTHHPYFTPTADELDFGYKIENPRLNRYLNSLRHNDRVIGTLLAHLETRGLERSTLVVLVGDHGEAFGRHNQWVHGSRIYEENLRVPCILINPVLFNGSSTDDGYRGLADIAPTILATLGKELPGAWQGRSFFDASRGERMYSFVPRGGTTFNFGFHEGGLKMIYEPVKQQIEVYDLIHDPHEATNIAAEQPAFVKRAQEHLAAWVQYQRRYFDKALTPTARE